MTKPITLLALVAGLTLPLSTASFANGDIPTCTSDKVIKKLIKRYNITERKYWQNRDLALSDVTKIHQHALNPFPDSAFDRRYCHAVAHFQNGKQRKIHYLIEDAGGLAGFTWNVEYCVSGQDPWKYYDRSCRVVRGYH